MSWLSWLLYLLSIAEFQAPSVRVTFRLNGDPSMPLAGTATVTLSNSSITLSKRPVTVAINGTRIPDLDAISGPVTFPCNEDDKIEVTAQDVSKGGVASPVASASFVAVDTATAPAGPAINFSFVLAPVAS